MARHHKNPLGDRSGACRLAEPVSVAVGPAAAVLNFMTVVGVVAHAMAASQRRHTPDGRGCFDPMVPDGRGRKLGTDGCDPGRHRAEGAPREAPGCSK